MKSCVNSEIMLAAKISKTFFSWSLLFQDHRQKPYENSGLLNLPASIWGHNRLFKGAPVSHTIELWPSMQYPIATVCLSGTLWQKSDRSLLWCGSKIRLVYRVDRTAADSPHSLWCRRARVLLSTLYPLVWETLLLWICPANRLSGVWSTKRPSQIDNAGPWIGGRFNCLREFLDRWEYKS